VATPYVAAAPAVVEPSNKLVELRSERRGRIQAIFKQAGDPIREGEKLVQIDDAIAQAAVAEAEAELALAEARVEDLLAWDRPEKRAGAKARLDYAQARYERAERELKRVHELFAQKSAPQIELDDAEEELQMASSELEEARQELAMSQAGPTEAELKVARAQATRAKSALELARTELALLTIRSPLDGHVVYRHLEPGEVVDPEVNVPILSIGKLDEVRLRAEVDEADIELVRVGQPVEATAEAFGDRVFHGRVVHLEPMMGRKTIRTQRTTEQQDTKVREVLIELHTGNLSLPIDLQMTVRFIRLENGDAPLFFEVPSEPQR
jgi:multidrug resistance efflux pump